MGALIRSFDWSATPLGPWDAWSASQRLAVGIMLNSGFPVALYWGRELTVLYNDAWSAMVGNKHPSVLGRSAQEVWPEIWDEIGPLFDQVYSTGEGLWSKDRHLPMQRHGYTEECYFNFSLSPVRGDDGSIEGVFNAVVETTERVLSERRLRTLSALAAHSQEVRTAEEACRRAAGILAENEHDSPFSLIYLMNEDGAAASLVAHSGAGADPPATPSSVDIFQDLVPAAEPFRVVAERNEALLVKDAQILFGISGGTSPESAIEAMVLPIARRGQASPTGFLVAGVNPRRRVDPQYQSFFELAASHVATGIATAQSYEAERKEIETLEWLNRVGTAIAAELDLERAVQVVTDAATELSGAAFGAFFYNVIDAQGEAYTLYTLSGAPREAFAKFPMPRNTAVFGPTFRGEGIVRSADITKDPRFGRNAPYHGMPEGHLPVRSYLAAPVQSESGEVLGGLFFGHPERGVFDERAERLVSGIATQAGIALDKARLYRAAQNEIEQRTRTEAALRQSEQLLERKVTERTAELTAANERLREEALQRERTEQALRQAQKMEGIGQLTGGVAHDFNNLLTVILGNLETLQRHLGQPTRNMAAVERSARQAMRGAERAASLTQRLLAFSRQQPLDPRPLDANRLVGAMSDLLRRTLGEQIAIETVFAGGLWLVHADPNQLEVAILNLAVNARDAMPDGGKLTIETANAHLDETYAASQAEVVPGQYVVICISDTGGGMSAATVDRAFEPFFTTKEVGHGTGLGLSQVYGFVKQSGGHVKIYSEVGEGTTVKIYLPRIYSAEGASDQTGTKVPSAGGKETILVVEDDDDVRAHTADLLGELGYNVVDAADGDTALRRIEEHPEIKLLFTDVGLPGGMNGRQLADEALRRRQDLKVLFTTGYARNAIIHDGRLDRGVQLITKPFTYAALASKLRDVLDAQAPSGRILVVEDDLLVQTLAVENLQELGFAVETATSATTALNKFRLTPAGFDGAVVDIGLPGGSGEVLVAELRAQCPSLPIIIATGHDESALPERFRRDRRISFLGKPYTMEQLYTALRAVGVERPVEPDM